MSARMSSKDMFQLMLQKAMEAVAPIDEKRPPLPKIPKKNKSYKLKLEATQDKLANLL